MDNDESVCGRDPSLDWDEWVAQAKDPAVVPQTIGEWASMVSVLIVDRLSNLDGLFPGVQAACEDLVDFEAADLADIIQGILVDHSDVPAELPALLPPAGEG